MKVLIAASALVLLCLTHVTTATNDLDEVIDDGDFDLDFGDDGMYFDVDEVSVAVREELEKQLEDRQISCSCSGSSCSCCADIKIGKLNLNDAVCLRVTRSGTQVTLVVKVGRRTIYSKTISLGENRDVTKVKKRQLRKTAAKYTIREDVLYHDGILVAKRNQVPEILQEFHDNYVSGGHLGMNKTYKKVLERYFWHGMKQEVEDYCRSCCVCQNMNACRKKPAAPLHPIPVPKKKWSLVGMDIIGPLQVTDRGNQYIVALTDHFTKFPVAKAIPCKSSEEVARFMYETICIFGAFDSLITDQGREFINFALDILTDRFNINHRISSAYHPETNGQRERDNRTLKDTLVKITDNDDWDELLPAALFAYRTSVHKSTQFSPFLALYGEQAKLPFDVTGDANEQDLNEEIMDTMKGIHEEVKNKIGENISRAQKKQKEYYDSRRAYDHGFRIGDKVLIINAARVHRMGGKMAPRFVGPYEVISVLPKGRLQLKNTKSQSLPGPCIKFGGGKLCLKFTNVSLNPLRACARLDAKFWIFKLGSFKLGCFRV
nr:hypothetical protein BaRGS_008007 [Batillaria attramentaria]